MRDPYPVCAWRVGRRSDGGLLKRLVVCTSDYPAMMRWLVRTRGARRPYPHTLWLDEADRPATAVRQSSPRRRRS